MSLNLSSIPRHERIKRISKSLQGVRNVGMGFRVTLGQCRLQGSEVEKVYVARVLGVFPQGKSSAKAGLAWDPQYNHVTAVEEGTATDACGRTAKASHTDFERIAVSPDGRTSLVRCW